jgi:outer membrane protein assembly factor BamB
MKKSHFLLIGIFLGMTILLSACMPGPRVTGSPGITTEDDMVYVAYGTFVYALDITDGSVSWSYPEKASNQVVFYAQPLVSGDYVYVGDLAKAFHKLDRQTGEVVWTFSDAEGFFMAKAAEADGVVYIPCNDGTLYALDENGNLLWQFDTGHYLWSQPQIVDDVIYLGAMDHFVYAISKDGEELWSAEMGGAVVAAPKISADGSILYVGSMHEQMDALDTSNGDVLWSFDTENSIWGEALLVENTLYFADSGGKIYALDAETGDPVWQTEYSGNVVGGLALIEDGFALTTEEGVVKAFDFDGSPKWEATLDGEIYQAPSVSNDYIVVGAIGGDHLVYGFQQTGVQLWSTTPE